MLLENWISCRASDFCKENIGIFDFALTDSEMKEIRSLNTESRFYIPRQSDLQNFLRFNLGD